MTGNLLEEPPVSPVQALCHEDLARSLPRAVREAVAYGRPVASATSLPAAS